MNLILNLLEKGKIYKYMFNLFLILPIIYLTNIIYQLKYGFYTIRINNIDDILNYLHKENTWYAIMVFCLLFIFVGLFESIILPFITSMKKSEKINKSEKRLKVFINYAMKSFIGINIYNKSYNDINTEQREFFSVLYKIPTAIFLYGICFYKVPIVMVILILFSIFFFYSIFKTLMIYKKRI